MRKKSHAWLKSAVGVGAMVGALVGTSAACAQVNAPARAPALPSPAPAQAAVQAAASGQAPQTGGQTVDSSTAGRFIAGCNEAMEHGQTAPGCQAPLYRNELERLKREALTTQNPQLLSFVGDAYSSQRTGIGDLSQAYRWYLMAAVRGDPSALRRLSDMNRKGRGTPQDNVKAMGYARLAERFSSAGVPSTSDAQRNVVNIINELGNELAAEEMALAESFANQMDSRIRTLTPGLPAAQEPRAGGTVQRLPAETVPAPAGLPASAAPTPGSVLPGVPAALPR